MNKKKWAIAALVACLGVASGILGGSKLFKQEWSDRKEEFAAGVSKKFLESGVPSKVVADKAASCLAEVMVSAAAEAQCSPKGEDVMEVMKACIQAHQELQITLTLAVPSCIEESLQ